MGSYLRRSFPASEAKSRRKDSTKNADRENGLHTSGFSDGTGAPRYKSGIVSMVGRKSVRKLPEAGQTWAAT